MNLPNLTHARRPVAKALLSATFLASGVLVTPAANAALSFTFDYSGNTAGVGFLSATDGAARQQALATAGNLFSTLYGSHFIGNAVLDFSVTSFEDTAVQVLASAGSSAIGVASPGFGNGEVIRNKIQTGTDLNGAGADGSVAVNFGYSWELNPNTPAVVGSTFDLYAALYHEFTHALGFGSNIPGDGSAPGTYSKWDQFLTNASGARVVNADFSVNQAAYLQAQTDGGRFDGANAVAAYGNQSVPLVVNSDISHLNTDAFSPPTVPGPYMMVPSRDTGPQEARVWSAVEVGILTDLGYVTAVPEPSTILLMLAGIGVIGAVRRKKA